VRSADAQTVASAATAGSAPLFDPEIEVRFAVVMYGGSSLAIYMNGVVRELLRLVRSPVEDPTLTDIEIVCR